MSAVFIWNDWPATALPEKPKSSFVEPPQVGLM
jgi:hypothetical protein